MKGRTKKKRLPVFLAILLLFALVATNFLTAISKVNAATETNIHNFTKQGLTSSVYSITGAANLSSSKGTIDYNGLKLTQCLKIETDTQIAFTAPSSGIFTMVFNPYNGSVNCKVNGTKITGNTSTGVLTFAMTSGTQYTITKADVAYLYYMSMTVDDAGDNTPTPTPENPSTPNPDSTTGDIYVSPDASSGGTGTYNNPMTLEKAITSIQAGKNIWMLPGTYKFNNTILVSKTNSGTPNAYKTIRRYSGTVTLDFSSQSTSDSNRGVVLAGSYWKWYGIDIKSAGDNGMLLAGNSNIIELCQFYKNRDSGLQISRYDTSAKDISQWPSNNLIKNCTSYDNCDESGENADGFAAKLTCGNGNVFDGCMAYNNSDDGWDLYAKKETGPIGVVTIRNCIAFRNGKTTSGDGTAKGDMNGFKLGGSGVGTPHIIENCMAFENGAHGFTDNNNPSAIRLSNVTSFNNSMLSGNKKANFQLDRASGPIVYNAIGISSNKIGSDKIIGATGARIIYYQDKYYEFQGSTGSSFSTTNKDGTVITPNLSDIFVSVTAPGTSTNFHSAWRNSDGSINTHGYLQIKSSSKYATFSTTGQAIGAIFGN